VRVSQLVGRLSSCIVRMSATDPAEGLGAVLGPRASGRSRSTTVLSGQQQPQLDSHIGRHMGLRAVYGMQRVTAWIGLARPADRSLAAEDRSAEGVRDRTEPERRQGEQRGAGPPHRGHERVVDSGQPRSLAVNRYGRPTGSPGRPCRPRGGSTRFHCDDPLR
jgi:hypothetical protein